MRISELPVPGAYRIDPDLITDARGVFYETIRYDGLRGRTGTELTVRQVNYSISRKNVLRGIHATPGEAKLVTCVRGVALDIAVDIRMDSPTFGRHAVNRLDSAAGTAVYLPDGFGHAFLALTDDMCVSYLCSAEYVPGTMLVIDALDPALALPWNLAEPAIRSEKDAQAPSLAKLARQGTLPPTRAHNTDTTSSPHPTPLFHPDNLHDPSARS
jgi:NDP-hexose 5-epimerase